MFAVLFQLLLPRVVMMYSIIGLAFFIYITRIPERFFKGKHLNQPPGPGPADNKTVKQQSM